MARFGCDPSGSHCWFGGAHTMHPDGRFRRKFIESFFEPKSLHIVEIGALNSPTFPPEEYSVRFIDYASREQLIRDNAANPAIAPERIVNVHYVSPDPIYSQVISERFDLAIANHVIEHIPDTVRWLQEISAILNDGGHIFLSVPDRRYTFDYLKRETNIADVLRAYRDKQTRPTFYQLFEHYYFRRPLNADDCWSGRVVEMVKQPGMPIQEAYRHAERAAALPYISTHCHIYTTESFKALIQDLQALGLLQLEIAQIRDVDPAANEFHVLLRKV